MLPMLITIFSVLSIFLAFIFLTIPFIAKIASFFGLLIVFLSVSWHCSKFIHTRLCSKLFGSVSVNKKAILITGCDSGFGYGSAIKLNQLGFHVFAGCLFPDGEGVKQLKLSAKYPDKLDVIKLNVTSDDDIESAFQTVNNKLKETGYQLWGLVNNAGVARLSKIEWSSFDYQFLDQFRVNVFGVVKVSRKFLPLLRASSGRLVTVSSINSRLTYPDSGVYSMTKAALTPFQDALRQEVSKFGVKIISIEPSFAATPLYNPDIILSTFSKMLNESSNHVREAYSSDDVDRLRLSCEVPRKFMSVEQTYNKTVDNITASLVDYEPHYRYCSMPVWFNCIYMILPSLPREWDYLFWKTTTALVTKDKIKSL